jgi:hypothetical protein
MSTLAQTISRALQSVGPAAEDRMCDILAEFDNLNLSGEERLAAVATTIAATAFTHHRRHRAIYLDAVRTWSLEISASLDPMPLRLRMRADSERIADGAEILIGGVDSLIEMMAASGAGTQDRLVTELAVVSRLLGQNDARTVHMSLSAVDRALGSADFAPGTIVLVPLRHSDGLVSRESDLALLEPRGYA